MNKIITIGREFGSGGRSIAKMCGETLNIPVYDNDLLVRIAKETGFAEAYVAENGENSSLSSLIARGLSRQGAWSQPTAEDYLWDMQRKVILDLAAKGPCIIVGRCADYILRGKADCLRVFIYADAEKRAARIVNLYGENADSPEKRLRDKDRRRAAFYTSHTDMTWGEARNYHLCLDSGALGLEKCRDIICLAYQG